MDRHFQNSSLFEAIFEDTIAKNEQLRDTGMNSNDID